VTNEPVGGLAVDGTEIGFAIDDCGCDSALLIAGSWRRGDLENVLEGV
jgi:hypothetical protein